MGDGFMQTKLTLRLDNQLIKKAKIFAERRGLSLSQVVAHYFSLLNQTTTKADDHILPMTRALRGVLKNAGIDEKDYLKHLEDKNL